MKARREREREEAADSAEEEGAIAAEAEAVAKYEKFQKRADELTKQMDLSIRGVIDDLNWLAGYPNTLQALVEKVERSSEEQRKAFDKKNEPPPIKKAKLRRIPDEEEDDDEDKEEGPAADEGEGEEQPVQRPLVREFVPLDPSETPHLQLASAIAQQSRQWNSQSLTDRYARDNNYKGWKGALWDAQNPGENPPPMPHETLWFAPEEGRSQTLSLSSTQQTRQRGTKRTTPTDTSFTEPGSEEESDLEIASATTNIRCPITLLPYTHPLTSKTCPHSYERAAILEMLSTSPAPLSATQLSELSKIRDVRARARQETVLLAAQPRQVRCPDAGCSATIHGEEDLFEDQLLKRRVARILAREAAKNAPATSDIDEDEDGEDVVRGTQCNKPVGVTSSPVAPLSMKAKRVKNERALRSARDKGKGRESVVPNSQVGGEGPTEGEGEGEDGGEQESQARLPRGTQILDLEDED